MTMTEYDWADTLRRDFDERLVEMKQDPCWQDVVHEIADGAVPVYNTDRVALWLDMGLPDIDDPGLVEGETDVIKIIGVAIYEQATERLFDWARNAELD